MPFFPITSSWLTAELREHNATEDKQSPRQTQFRQKRQEDECGIFVDTGFSPTLLSRAARPNVTESWQAGAGEVCTMTSYMVKFLLKNKIQKTTHCRAGLWHLSIIVQPSRMQWVISLCIFPKKLLQIPITAEVYPIQGMCTVTRQLNDPLQKVITLKKTG